MTALRAVATGVLILALLAILWLFFAPQPKPATTFEPTPTPPAAMATGAQPAGSAAIPAGTVAAMSSPGALARGIVLRTLAIHRRRRARPSR